MCTSCVHVACSGSAPDTSFPRLQNFQRVLHATQCTPGHQNLDSPTKLVAVLACQLSGPRVRCVALASKLYKCFIPSHGAPFPPHAPSGFSYRRLTTICMLWCFNILRPISQIRCAILVQDALPCRPPEAHSCTIVPIVPIVLESPNSSHSCEPPYGRPNVR